MTWLYVYLAVGLLVLLQAHLRRIFWTRSWYEFVGAIVAVALCWPVLLVIETIGAFGRWREEREIRRRGLDDGRPTDPGEELTVVSEPEWAEDTLVSASEKLGGKR